MTTEVLATIHDQDILLECEASGQFDAVSHTYLFVGPRPVDRIPADVNVIVARDHNPNVEHWPSFYDFTGWHVLACSPHTALNPTIDRIITLQYDMRIADPDIVNRVDKTLDAGPGPIAFTAGHNLAHNWMLLIPGFRETFDTGMELLGVDQTTWPDFNEWPCTQGMAWHLDEFIAYNRWITPLFKQWHTDLWAGHLMERTVKPWTMTTAIPERYLPGAIVHEGRDCHGTCHRMGGDIATYEARAATFGKIIEG